MNKYTYNFSCVCPVNRTPIDYTLTIQSESTIYVEEIIAAASEFNAELHENIADAIHKRLGGLHVMTAHHHGVDVETVRS